MFCLYYFRFLDHKRYKLRILLAEINLNFLSKNLGITLFNSIVIFFINVPLPGGTESRRSVQVINSSLNVTLQLHYPLLHLYMISISSGAIQDQKSKTWVGCFVWLRPPQPTGMCALLLSLPQRELWQRFMACSLFADTHSHTGRSIRCSIRPTFHLGLNRNERRWNQDIKIIERY